MSTTTYRYEFHTFKGLKPGARITALEMKPNGLITCEVEGERDLTLRANACKNECCTAEAS